MLLAQNSSNSGDSDNDAVHRAVAALEHSSTALLSHARSAASASTAADSLQQPGHYPFATATALSDRIAGIAHTLLVAADAYRRAGAPPPSGAPSLPSPRSPLPTTLVPSFAMAQYVVPAVAAAPSAGLASSSFLDDSVPIPPQPPRTKLSLGERLLRQQQSWEMSTSGIDNRSAVRGMGRAWGMEDDDETAPLFDGVSPASALAAAAVEAAAGTDGRHGDHHHRHDRLDGPGSSPLASPRLTLMAIHVPSARETTSITAATMVPVSPGYLIPADLCMPPSSLPPPPPPLAAAAQLDDADTGSADLLPPPPPEVRRARGTPRNTTSSTGGGGRGRGRGTSWTSDQTECLYAALRTYGPHWPAIYAAYGPSGTVRSVLPRMQPRSLALRVATLVRDGKAPKDVADMSFTRGFFSAAAAAAAAASTSGASSPRLAFVSGPSLSCSSSLSATEHGNSSSSSSSSSSDAAMDVDSPESDRADGTIAAATTATADQADGTLVPAPSSPIAAPATAAPPNPTQPNEDPKKRRRRPHEVHAIWTPVELAAFRAAVWQIGRRWTRICAEHGATGSVDRSLGRFTAKQLERKFYNEGKLGRPISVGPHVPAWGRRKPVETGDGGDDGGSIGAAGSSDQSAATAADNIPSTV